MATLKLTSSAENDLVELWHYVAVENHSPAAADDLIDEIAAKLQRVLHFPRSGTLVEHLRKNTRRIVVRKRFLAFYELIDDGILVLRVLHGARLLRPEDFERQRFRNADLEH